MKLNKKIFENAIESKVALVDENSQFTYQELQVCVKEYAAQLQEAGVVAGDVVVIRFEPSTHVIALILALWELKAAYVPISEEMPESRVNTIISDCEPKLILIRSHDDAGRLQQVGQIAEYNLFSHESGRTRDTDDCRYILYTSGTTGNPKGVIIKEDNLLAYMNAVVPLDNRSSDIYSLSHSLSFDISVNEYLASLVHGATLAIPSTKTRKNIIAYFDFLQRFDVNRLHQTPSAFIPLMSLMIEKQSEVCLPLRRVDFGGEPLDIRKLEPLKGSVYKDLELTNGYGPTEATVLASVKQLDLTHDAESNGNIGTPLSSGKIRLYKDDQEVEHGEVGELTIFGKQLADGYLNNPEKTKQSFTELDGQRGYRTGDLAKFNDAGELIIFGRIDNQVKINGYRIELEDIESNLLSTNLVKDCAVVVDRSTQMDNMVCFYVADSALERNNFIDALSQRLPEYMVPQTYVSVAEIPLNQSSKRDTRALLAILDASRESSSGVDSSQLHKIVSRYTAASLSNENSTLADLGFDSLAVMALTVDLSKAFNVHFSIKDITFATTLAEIETCIENTQSDDTQYKSCQTYPANTSQQRYYKNYKTYPFNDRLTSVFKFGDDIRPCRLEEFSTLLISKHNALRTAINETDAGLVADVRERVDNIKHHISNDEHFDPLTMLEEANWPYSYEDGKVCNILIVTAPNATYLYFNVSHMAFDGFSYSILLEEIKSFLTDGTLLDNGAGDYAELSAHEQANWQEMKTKFAASQPKLNSLFSDQGFKACPASKPGTEGKARFAEILLTTAQTQAVDKLLKQSNTSHLHFFCALFAKVIGQVNGLSKVNVVSPILQRPTVRSYNTIGCYLNLMVSAYNDIEGDLQAVVERSVDDFNFVFDLTDVSFNIIKKDIGGYVSDVVVGGEIDFDESELESLGCESVDVDNYAISKNAYSLFYTIDQSNQQVHLTFRFNSSLVDENASGAIVDVAQQLIDSL
ncbi:non-ribosomal peptide synthetase [Vibrio hyugaensis]|uniref:non-ribosomal peptide synthetase n=1 Tax=Vibrio hyugaensis TaxID=1534743 RepID=UPI0005EFBAA3|nr:non-ribosomal peptide synthetase [Vibrio hyugaensis]